MVWQPVRSQQTEGIDGARSCIEQGINVSRHCLCLCRSPSVSFFLSHTLSNCLSLSLSISVCLCFSPSVSFFLSHSLQLSFFVSPYLSVYFCLCMSVSISVYQKIERKHDLNPEHKDETPTCNHHATNLQVFDLPSST